METPSPLLEVMIRKAVADALTDLLSRLDGLTSWVRPSVYMSKYGLSPMTLHRYAVDGRIPSHAIRGAGKGKRYNILIKPLDKIKTKRNIK